jgi:O-antigen ligase
MSVYNLLGKYYKEVILLIIFLVFSFLILNFNFILFSLILLAALFILVISWRPVWGLYLVVLTYPFINWQIYLFSELNLPPVDFLAILLFIAYLIYLIRTKKFFQIKLPFFLFFFIFLAFASLSLIDTYFFDISLKYLLRPILFCYLMFVVLPYNIINSGKEMFKIFWLVYILGIALSLMGIISWIIKLFQFNTFPRAVPLTLFGTELLGSNQNLLAEFLIVIIPLGFILSQKYKKGLFPARPREKGFIFFNLGLALMALVTLLTFSRAGWLVLLLEFLFIFFILFPRYFTKDIYQKKIKKFVANYGILILIAAIPLIIMMSQLLTSDIAFSSNHNRIMQWQVGLEMFSRNPLFGQGAGTFVEILNRDPYYLFEYGTDIDAHGIVLKLISEVGLLGSAGFFVFIGVIFGKSIQLFNKLKLEVDRSRAFIFGCLLLSAGGGVIFQLFNTSYFTAKMWLPLGLLLVGYKFYASQKIRKKS